MRRRLFVLQADVDGIRREEALERFNNGGRVRLDASRQRADVVSPKIDHSQNSEMAMDGTRYERQEAILQMISAATTKGTITTMRISMAVQELVAFNTTTAKQNQTDLRVRLPKALVRIVKKPNSIANDPMRTPGNPKL